MVCHRRMGKTVACVWELVIRALYSKKKNPRYSYICPTFTQAKDVAWTYLKDAVKDFAVQIRESELRVVLPNGAWITLYGSDNQDRLRGIFHDGVILDEYGDCRPSLWGEIILPALLDRDGWAVFIGTPKGTNHFYHTYERSKVNPAWYSYIMPADQSGVLSEQQLEMAKQEYVGREAEWEQEMLCSFTAAVRGTYYADLIHALEVKGQIKHQELYDPNQPVNVAADIGYSDSTAFWFWQARPDGLAIIDYYENQGKELSHYFEILESKDYEYEYIFLPHDARAKTLQTGRSTIEQFLEGGWPCRIAPRLSVQHGIDAVRAVLPRCYFDSEKCYTGIENLRAYKRQYDEIKQVYSDKPLHDFASDGADAFRYLSLVAKVNGSTVVATPHSDIPSPQTHTLPQITLDKLFEAREGERYGYERMRI